MTWYAIYNKNTGELFSTGTVVADDSILIANSLNVVKIDGPAEGRQWNPKTLQFEGEKRTYNSARQ